ncbi:cytochrome P450 family protein [Streptomyces amritsarensis]|nr:cytochrome P450 [Streptomyces amritsarensis]
MNAQLETELPSMDSPEYVRDPHAFFTRLRFHSPVAQAVGPGGLKLWVVSGYDEARLALADPRLSKNVDVARRSILANINRKADVMAFAVDLVSHMLNSDPPDHTRLRSLVNKAFTVRASEKLRPAVESITRKLLDDMAAHTETDLLHAFAHPLPMAVLCELLGVPLPDRERFDHWLGARMSNDPQRIAAAAPALLGYLRELVDHKRRAPADDLLSRLVQAQSADGRLSPEELVATTFLLLVAGHETTVHLIAAGMATLLLHPEQLARLQRDRGLLPGAVEELLRYEGPVKTATLRFTTEPVELAGTRIPPNSPVAIALTSANRDDKQFDAADTLDITRPTAGHLAFGHGIHYCVGAPLARLEAHVAFTGLLDRYPDMQLLCAPGDLVWQPGMFRGLASLPIRLRPPGH